MINDFDRQTKEKASLDKKREYFYREIKPAKDKFFQELKELEERYGISVCTGCGCCGGGYSIKVGDYYADLYEEDDEQHDKYTIDDINLEPRIPPVIFTRSQTDYTDPMCIKNSNLFIGNGGPCSG